MRLFVVRLNAAHRPDWASANITSFAATISIIFDGYYVIYNLNSDLGMRSLIPCDTSIQPERQTAQELKQHNYIPPTAYAVIVHS